MAAPMELVLSADSAGQVANCTVWDPLTGSVLLTYRGGNTAGRGLAVLGGQYLLGAQLGKNFINVWELQRKDQLLQKIVCPGPVTCLAVSPNGLYLVAGISESIYLWEVYTGNLLAILNSHYQDVTCLTFTDDSSHILSGAKDSLVLVWSLYSVLQAETSRGPEPRHVWSRHSLPITDLQCGIGGPQARAVTSSLDQTVKLWDISSGDLLLSVLFDVRIMSVTFDPAEYHLFCGGSDGSIFQVDLCASPVQREKTFHSELEKVFRGHRNQVTCLSVSLDGSMLVSGSNDETVCVWDIHSKQCLRTVPHRGPVTNAFIMPAPANMLRADSKPSFPLPRFSKHLQGAEGCEGPDSGGVTLRLGRHQLGSEDTYLQRAAQLHTLLGESEGKNLSGLVEQLRSRTSELEEELNMVRKINKDLFDFSTSIITKQ
ncbi:WD repeat-containing protein 18 [Bombina bombina]|uniref:WD repeat-containing protein 18 n=1 Tax=Bombina bombina TaxID=8345 RepID=UPI00235AE01E|nr:WD repeat-containing protein 18 [Bombina bombina]